MMDGNELAVPQEDLAELYKEHGDLTELMFVRGELSHAEIARLEHVRAQLDQYEMSLWERGQKLPADAMQLTTMERLHQPLQEIMSSRSSIKLDELVEKLGITRPEGIALLAEQTGGQLVLLVYHSCGEEPVAERPLSWGFQPAPFTCPRCGAVVQQNGLLYEVEFRKEAV